MKYTAKKYIKHTYVNKIKCDKCGKMFSERDWIDWQEAVCIDTVGGYGSVFGDGSKIKLDLCQVCFKEICGKYVKTRK